MSQRNKLPLTEHLDFHYLLGLMPPMTNEPEFAWLPELFTIIGHKNLIQLSKYAGGETIKIPTLEQIADCVEALQWYYDVYVKNSRSSAEIPEEFRPLVGKIVEVYKNAR